MEDIEKRSAETGVVKSSIEASSFKNQKLLKRMN